VTRPFGFEGKRRIVQAEAGIERLRSEVDTLIVIPNDRLLSISDRNVSVLDAFKAADQVLLSGVQGITDLITTPGLINLDFADVKSVMSGAGSALMGTGSSRGDDRAVAAAEMAISSPLLEASIDGARGVLLSIQGGSDLGLFEINEAAQLVSNAAAVDANIIFGAVIDDALGDEVRVTVIAAGLDENQPGRSAGGAGSGAAFGYDGNSSGGTAYSSGVSSGGTGSGTAAAEPAGGPGGAGGTGGMGGMGGMGGATSGGSGGGPAGRAEPGSRPAAAAGDGTPVPRPPAVPALAGHGSHGSFLGAPVGTDASAGRGTGTAAQAASPAAAAAPGAPGAAGAAETEMPGAPGGSAPRDGTGPRPADASPARAFDLTSSRRRPVVFEEDDDLDVPDFLK